MKIEETLTFSQQVFKFKLPDELCDALNERMDKEVKDKLLQMHQNNYQQKLKKNIEL